MYRKTIFKHSYIAKLRSWLENHPRQVVLGMLVCITLSAGLSFTVLRYSERKSELKLPAASGISPASTAKALLETAELQIMMETILRKDRLSHSDSLLIKKAVRRLRELQNSKP